MIPPEQFDEIAFRIVSGAEARYIRRIVKRLTSSLIKGGHLTAKDLDDIAVLARSNHVALQDLTIRYKKRINEDIERIVKEILAESAANDLKLLKTLYPSVASVTATRLFHQISAQTVIGIQSIIARQNIALIGYAERLWYEVAGDAVTAWNHGLATMDQILAKSVSRLAEGGLSLIDYKSGVKTSIDAAVRRHAVSQIGQASGRITLGYMEEYGHDLVFTSAHFGARPEHEIWQGKAYSLSGRKFVDGVLYPDFVTSTEYGQITGILGVNCRHSFGPYYPGVTELPTIEKTRNGMTSAEYYEATQKQRYYERQIRAKKQTIAAGKDGGFEMTQERLELGKLQGKLKAFVDEKGLIRNPPREKAYGIGTQPRALRKSILAAPPTPKPPAMYSLDGQPMISKPSAQKPPIKYSLLSKDEIKSLQKQSDLLYSDLPINRIAALNDYTTGGHDVVNQLLYGVLKETHANLQEVWEQIHLIDNSIERFELKNDIIVFRGTKAKYFIEWNVGDVKPIGAYLSTSVVEKEAQRYVDEIISAGEEAIMIEIRVPKMAPGVYIGDNTAFVRNQYEYLTGRGLSYRTINRTIGRVILEVVL